MQNSRRRSKVIRGNAVVAKAVQTQNSPSRSVSFGGARTDEQLSSIKAELKIQHVAQEGTSAKLVGEREVNSCTM
jgi:hypothetical protein